MKRTIFAIFCAVSLICPLVSHAATTEEYTFETDTTRSFSPLRGKGAEGSSLEVVADKSHDGQKSLQLKYQSTGGWIEFSPSNTRKVFNSNTLYLSLWVYGSGQRDFSVGAIRFQDNNGEAFQWEVPGLAEALAGEGWREVRAQFDLTKIGAHWGQTSDGILDKPFGWFGFAATRSAQTQATGTVYLDDVRLSDEPLPETKVAQAPTTPNTLVAQNPRLEAPNATLSLAPVTATPEAANSKLMQWVFPPGQDVLFRANVTLRSPAQGLSLLWKATDAFNTVIARGSVPFTTAQNNSLEIRVPKPPRGVIYFEASLLNARQEVVTTAASRAAIFTSSERPAPMSPFVWGVAAHLGRNNGQEAEAEIDVMRRVGFAVTRYDLLWNEVQPKPDVWNWEKYDRIAAALKQAGVMPTPILSYGARWATTGDPDSKDWHQWNNTPPKTEAYVNYAREAVKRYGNQTRYWEIWNEPDIDFWLGSVEQYTQLVDATIPALKAVNPNIQVMNGGFTETRRRPDFIPTYLKTVKNRPDIYAFHTHMQFENLLRAESGTKERLKEAGWTGKNAPPIWLNESGYSNWRGAPESEQAVQLVKKMAYASSIGLGAYIWYDLRDDGLEETEIEHNFGLVKRDFRPKASLVAARTLLDTLGGRRASGRLPLGENNYGLIHRGLGRTVLTLWRQSQNSAAARLPLLLRAQAKGGPAVELLRSDIFGNTTPLKTQNGVFVLTPDNVPQYVLAQGETVQIEPVGAQGLLMSAEPSLVLPPGETRPWPVKIVNPFSTPLRGQLRVAGGTPVAVNLSPNASKTYEVPVTGRAASGSRDKLEASFESPQLPQVLRAIGELHMAYSVPTAPQKLEISLPRTNLVSLFEATPMRELHFAGDSDLGAQAQLQRTANGIEVQITVTDQTHFVSAAPGTWWKGDSLQWGIGVGNQMWEWTAALLPEGPKMILSLAPSQKPPMQVGAPTPIEISRLADRTVYRWVLPQSLPDGTPLPDRFGFSFLVNDSDGADRKGWIELTPGIGREKNPGDFAPFATKP